MRVIIQEYSGRTNKTLQSVPEGKQGRRGTTKLQGHLAQGLRDATPALQSPCWHHPWVQLPANTHPSRQQVVAQILESLPPPRRAWGMFPVLGFHLAHSWLPGAFENWESRGELQRCVCFRWLGLASVPDTAYADISNHLNQNKLIVFIPLLHNLSKYSCIIMKLNKQF